MPVQKITPFLWFDNNAEEAMNFYTAVFRDAKIIRVSRYGAAGPGHEGAVMSGIFELHGQQFYALNGGPAFKFTEAISLFITCETQEEINMYWEKLTAGGGRESMCGWLKDKFGLSWQVVPAMLFDVLDGDDKAGAARAMQTMMQMRKLDIAALQHAYDGK